MILGALRQFLMVGIVAPTTFIGSAVVHLARNPEHHTLLKNDPSLVPDAVEEMLRLYTPYRGFARTARRDVKFGDKLVREGEVVAAVFTSGNRDEAIFDKPGDHLMPCQEFCSVGHEGMWGKVKVVDKQEFLTAMGNKRRLSCAL